MTVTDQQRAEWRDWARNTGLQRVGTEVNKILDALDEAAAAGWDAAVAAMRYEDGTRVEVVAMTNPYRAKGYTGSLCQTCGQGTYVATEQGVECGQCAGTTGIAGSLPPVVLNDGTVITDPDLTWQAQARLTAETQLRDMEIERNMLRITTRELTEALEAGDACGAVGCRAFARAESAESERDSLAVQLDEALGKVERVEALAEEIDRHAYTPECGDDRCRECLTAEAIRAALAGPSPTDEGGGS